MTKICYMKYIFPTLIREKQNQWQSARFCNTAVTTIHLILKRTERGHVRIAEKYLRNLIDNRVQLM